jgi:hypothetical protein
MLKTNKMLVFCVLFSSVVCIAGNSNILDKQFDDLYGASPLLNLPVEYAYSGPYESSSIDSVEFIRLPESLFPIFKLDSEIYEKDELSMARLPEYKNIKIIIVKVGTIFGATELFLYTLKNNKLIDELRVYSAGDVEYDGSTAATSLTSFAITKNYDIHVKHSIVPAYEDRDKEVNVTRRTYIINKSGKFVKKK